IQQARLVVGLDDEAAGGRTLQLCQLSRGKLLGIDGVQVLGDRERDELLRIDATFQPLAGHQRSGVPLVKTALPSLSAHPGGGGPRAGAPKGCRWPRLVECPHTLAQHTKRRAACYATHARRVAYE